MSELIDGYAIGYDIGSPNGDETVWAARDTDSGIICFGATEEEARSLLERELKRTEG